MYLTASTREAIEQNYELGEQIEIPFPERFNPQDRFYIYVPRRSKQSPAIAGDVDRRDNLGPADTRAADPSVQPRLGEVAR